MSIQNQRVLYGKGIMGLAVFLVLVLAGTLSALAAIQGEDSTISPDPSDRLASGISRDRVEQPLTTCLPSPNLDPQPGHTRPIGVPLLLWTNQLNRQTHQTALPDRPPLQGTVPGKTRLAVGPVDLQTVLFHQAGLPKKTTPALIPQSGLPIPPPLPTPLDLPTPTPAMTARDYFDRGQNYAEQGLHDQAIADYTKAIELDPRFALAYNNRGWAYHEKGLHDQAIADYTKAIELDPRFALAYIYRGGLSRKASSTRPSPTTPRPSNSIPGMSGPTTTGLIYGSKGLHDQAIADYTKAIELDPRHAWAYRNRGVAYERKGLYDQAIADYTKALEIDPNFELAARNLEQLLQRR